MGMSWRLLDLGAVDGLTMTNLYEAVAKAQEQQNSQNTLILNHPIDPFVNVGFHQIVEKEVDLSFVQQKQFPVIRRSIGGGTILDGPWEQDYFFIVRKKSQECPVDIKDFYRQFLSIVAATLRSFGVNAEYKPINDIVVRNRKISGNGGVSIGESMVLAGDILLDLPTELMTRVLKVPDEKFRDKLQKSLSEWMTSLHLELREVPSRDEVKQNLIKEFEKQIGVTIEKGQLSPIERKYLDELLMERRKKRWIFMKDMSHENLFQTARSRKIKVKEGVNICEGVYKAKKLIRITMETVDDHISEISISGDFFTDPHIGAIEKLERSIIGASLNKEDLRQRILAGFNNLRLTVTGMTIDDLVGAILTAKDAK
jgi:lipoate-protein ligase A